MEVLVNGLLVVPLRLSLWTSFFVLWACGGGGEKPTPAEDPGATIADLVQELPTVKPDLAPSNDPGSVGDLTVDPGSVSPTDEGTSQPEPGEFGWPCSVNSECLSGFCLPVTDGKACTQSCLEECPDGFRCELIELGGQDQTFLCVSLSQNLCRPCKNHGDCSGLVSGSNARCINFGESSGSFCGADCSGSLGCPDGYGCELLVDPADGQSYEQCLPLSGACSCSQQSIDDGAETTCGNEFCSGVRSCSTEGLTDCSAPEASEEICDGLDNDCDGVIDNGFLDTNSDDEADCVDTDDDGDGVDDNLDTCPLTPNAGQEDLDDDGEGDICDEDDDGDLVSDELDNCPTIANESQEDTDDDGIGDACEGDSDGDNVVDDQDNCPGDFNTGQEDFDGDEIGDVCDPDDDNDDIIDGEDNCPFNSQITGDLDEDGFGDACDVDKDGDGVDNTEDNCPNLFNEDQANGDGDSFGDICDLCANDAENDIDGDSRCADFDNCPSDSNPDQLDTDLDGIGNVCDPCFLDETNDGDGDGVCEDLDNCPGLSNSAQSNSDGDGFGDICDLCPDDASNDSDGDGVCGLVDNCPGLSNLEQEDADEDGLGDLCDTCPADPDNDQDGDGYCVADDNCPLLGNESQGDSDEDGLGDACDACVNDPENDTDGDTVCGDVDNCPGIGNTVQTDTDGDSLGDACDPCANDPVHDTPPPAPTSITGQPTVNGAQSGVQYSTPALVTAYSYNWTLPPGATVNSGAGTATISVTFGFLSGDVCVTASNGCGSSGTYCIPVEVSNVPAGVIAMWADPLATIPEGWAICDGSNGTPDLRGRYVKGSVSPVDVGTTGGSDSHDHGGLTGSTDLQTDTYTGTSSGGCGTGCNATNEGHSHSASHQHGFGPSTNQPAYKEVVFLMNLTGSPLSSGILTAWQGDTLSVPFGWKLSNGSNGTPAFIGMYLVGAPDGVGGGDAGGLEGHNHGATGFDNRSLHIGLSPSMDSSCDSGPGTSVGHSHDYDHQHQLPESSNDLPFMSVAFLQSSSSLSFPTGSILLWSGSSSAVPEGWALCDGSGATPDLRDRYLRAINIDEETGNTGGSATHDHGGATNLDGGGTTTTSVGLGSSGCASPLALHQHQVQDHQHSIPLAANHEPPFTRIHFIIRQ
jgi:hypothetical protein